MSLFSRRFWQSLIMHDRRFVTASTDYERAAFRLRTSRGCIVGESQVEFRIEFVEAVVELREAVGKLQAFKSRQQLGGCR